MGSAHTGDSGVGGARALTGEVVASASLPFLDPLEPGVVEAAGRRVGFGNSNTTEWTLSPMGALARRAVSTHDAMDSSEVKL
jgi:hypothetical protein